MLKAITLVCFSVLWWFKGFKHLGLHHSCEKISLPIFVHNSMHHKKRLKARLRMKIEHLSAHFIQANVFQKLSKCIFILVFMQNPWIAVLNMKQSCKYFAKFFNPRVTIAHKNKNSVSFIYLQVAKGRTASNPHHLSALLCFSSDANGLQMLPAILLKMHSS